MQNIQNSSKFLFRCIQVLHKIQSFATFDTEAQVGENSRGHRLVGKHLRRKPSETARPLVEILKARNRIKLSPVVDVPYGLRKIRLHATLNHFGVFRIHI